LTALAAAKSGQLTTRTDDDTGELTMAPGHGITTGQRLDVFWTGGHRRGMTVGTVAGDVVPIDGGSGDVLPANLTAITAQVPAEEAFNVVGNNLQFLAARASRRGAVSFCDSGNAEHLGFELNPTTGVDGGYQWYTGSGVTNPISGDTIAKVFFSNGSTAGTSNIRAEAGVN
jgi:hypothetical protein